RSRDFGLRGDRFVFLASVRESEPRHDFRHGTFRVRCWPRWFSVHRLTVNHPATLARVVKLFVGVNPEHDLWRVSPCPGAGREVNKLLVGLLDPLLVIRLRVAEPDRDFPWSALPAEGSAQGHGSIVTLSAERLFQARCHDAAGMERRRNELTLEI